MKASRAERVLPDAPVTIDGWANFFDDLAPRYEAAAFGGAGLAAVGARELAAVRAALSARSPGRVLDAGAGSGRITDACSMLGWSVTALDASSAMVARLRTRRPSLPVLHAPLGTSRLPLASSTFDAVVSLRVLKYVDDLDAALAELARVLRPGGIAVLEFANRRSVARFGYRDAPVRLATVHSFERALTRSGIEPTARVAGPRLPQPVWKHARSRPAARAAGACDRVIGAALGGDRTAMAARSVIVVGRRT